MSDYNEGTSDKGANSEGEGSTEYTAPATQADLDAIIERRLARERTKYADYEDLKSKQAEYEEWKTSQLTEQEKAVKEAREEGAREASTAYERKLVAAEAKTIASGLGFHDPSDALTALGDELPIKDGEPDADAIRTALEELAQTKPYLVKDSEPEKRGLKPGPRPRRGTPAPKPADPKVKAAAQLRAFASQKR